MGSGWLHSRDNNDSSLQMVGAQHPEKAFSVPGSGRNQGQLKKWHETQILVGPFNRTCPQYMIEISCHSEALQIEIQEQEALTKSGSILQTETLH